MTDLADRLKAATDDPTDYDAEPAELRLRTRRASQIEPREVFWTWRGWLPAGMVGLFAGRGGGGKSTIALEIAARCSRGGHLPDGQPAPLLKTLIFAAEDSPEHTIIPRLIAMGADLERIHIVDGIARNDEDPGWVQLRAHVALIEQAVRAHDIGLVIIDPVSSYIGDANGDKESDVRAGIMPLVAMAERTGCSVLMIRHVSKAGDGAHAGSRVLGSTAWHDVPRVVWMLADAPDEHQPDPREDGTRDIARVLGVVKSNLAAKPAARMCVQPVDGPLRWKPDASPVTIDECFIAPSDRSAKGKDAERWLTDYLRGGSKESGRLFADAKAEGMNEKTVRRTLKTLKAESFQIPGKMHGGWSWRLPNGSQTADRSLSPEDKDACNRESDNSPLHGSFSHIGQERKRPPYQGDQGHAADNEPAISDDGHLVTFPLSPLGANGQVRKETTAESTSEEEWSITI